MARVRWNKERIDSKCEELGIRFLNDEYDYKVNQDFECSCGNKFSRKFSNVLSNNQILCLSCSSKELSEKNRKRALESYDSLIDFVNNSNFGIEILSGFDEYKNNKTPLRTICSCGDIYYPTANSLKRSLNTNCKKCGNKKTGLKNRKPKDEILKAIRDEGYDVLDYEHKNGQHWIKVSCENNNHKSYTVDWGNFSMGNRCPYCNLSKGEEKVKEVLIDSGFDFEREVVFDELVGINGGDLRYDFKVYYEESFVLVEYDGEQHYKPKFGDDEFDRTQKHDEIKNNYCKERNIELLRISYKDFNNIEKILLNYFKIY